ncbi:COesterase domain-containing protein [Mycena chlorophos]|uniref:COesterase domain-containing protein n=1 Tax=Mycena chlorophos TaxID=658473 RepID=A0A8H6TMF8_MYCCL|nr:COesterase domain-containing protein [Mycena chlorophos]
MILDEKPPPPPYTGGSNGRATPPAAGWRPFTALPPHLLLQIVYSTFADSSDIVEQRKTLYWLSRGLRLVNRTLYTTSMNVLRSLYLPVYDSLIRKPYTSDPFPHHTHTQAQQMLRLNSVQRETTTFDMFIALKVREDVWMDDSELHLESEDTFADLFNLMQPRSRLEDLFRELAVEEGVVYIDRRRRIRTPGSSSADLRSSTGEAPPSSTVLRSAASHAALSQRISMISTAPSSSSSSSSSSWRGFSSAFRGKSKEPPTPIPPPSMKVTVTPLPFSALSIAFSSRRAGLMLSVPGRTTSSKRTVVEVSRTRDEPLEIAARCLVWALRDYLVDEIDGLLYQ